MIRFTEVQIGRKADRPELARALHLAKVTGATMVIAKLDRLSRNAVVLLMLRDGGMANDLTVGIMALVAQHQPGAITRWIKDALAVVRARPVIASN